MIFHSKKISVTIVKLHFHLQGSQRVADVWLKRKDRQQVLQSILISCKKSKHQSINETLEEIMVDRSFFFVKENPVNEKLAWKVTGNIGIVAI